MTDGYKYIDVFYHLQTLPRFKIEFLVTNIIGKASFSTLFYSDANYTDYIGETAYPDLVNGSNVFQTGILQSGNITMYVIGRVKLLQGTTVALSSFKINDQEHMESGTMTLETSPIVFEESVVNQYVYHTLALGQIKDPSFKIELMAERLVGPTGVEFLYYTDDSYTMMSSIQTTTLTPDTRFQVDTLNKYVVLRFKMLNKGYVKFSSFKIQQLEQGIIVLTTPHFVDDGVIVSETCFPANTIVQTDQGLTSIQKVIPYHHTIHGKNVVALTSTYSSDKELVYLRKDSIRKHYPTQDTLMSRKHKIYMKGKLKAAYRLAENYKGITLVPYQGQKLYNVVLEDYGIMNIHGLLCESLHPENPMAKLFCQMYRPLEQ